jgi:hypothetical protein
VHELDTVQCYRSRRRRSCVAAHERIRPEAFARRWCGRVCEWTRVRLAYGRAGVGTMVTSAVNARRLRGLALGATLCICRCLVGGTARTALVIKQQLAIATVSEPELWPAVQTSSDTPPPVTHPGIALNAPATRHDRPMGSLVAVVVEQPGSARVTRRLETLYQALAAVESSSQKATHVAALLRQCADDIHPVHVLPANPPATRAAVTPADRAAARDEAAAPVAGTKIAKAAPEGRKIRKTKGRQMDATKYATRHVALEILYIGWNYHGFALQESSKETVEVKP